MERVFKILFSVVILSYFLFGCRLNQDIRATYPKGTITNDSLTLDVGESVELDVLSNDFGIKEISHLSSPSHGTVALTNDNKVNYSPQPGYEGDDSFSYTAIDREGNQIDGIVRLYIGYCSGERLTNSPFANSPSADGSSSSQSFAICTKSQFLEIANLDNSEKKYLLLKKDVDLASLDFSSYPLLGAGAQKVFVHLDGNNKTISNLQLNTTGNDYLGLFKELETESVIENVVLDNFEVIGGTGSYIGTLAGKAIGAKLQNITVQDASLQGSGTYYGGVVGYLSGNAIDIAVSGALSSTGNYVGGLSGFSDSTCGLYKTEISNVASTINISGGDWTSGIAGYAKGNSCGSKIINSTYNGTLVGNDYVGGIAGQTQSVRLSENNTISGSITGHDYVGGVYGRSSDSTTVNVIYKTIVNANILGNDWVGGLSGKHLSPIQMSAAKGSVQGANSVGGLVGSFDGGELRFSYATGNVSATTSLAGGLVGTVTAGTLRNNYAAGAISSPGTKGGLIGQHNGTGITANFYDSQLGGVTNMCGAGAGTGCNNSFGKTTSEMKMATNYNSYAGWDFYNESDGPSDIWKLGGGNYPALWFENLLASDDPIFSGGDGSETDPYLISSLVDLNNIGYNPRIMDKFFKLTQDIDVSAGITNIGSAYVSFSGQFDGNNKTLSNLSINLPTTDYIGIFQYPIGATIKNLNLTNVSVTGRDNIGVLAAEFNGTLENINISGSINGRNYVGLAFGRSKGNNVATISNLTVSGSVSGQSYVGGAFGFASGNLGNSSSSATVIGSTDYVGGLLGFADFIAKAHCDGCSASGNVSGRDNVGGLVGQLTGTFRHSSASGTVSGRNYVGGLIGDVYSSSGKVYNSNATGNVNSIGSIAGGLVGWVEWHAFVRSSSASGNVNGGDRVGGVVGQVSGRLQNSFSTGSVTGNNFVGGVAGYYGPVTDPEDFYGCYSRGSVIGKTGVTGDQHIGGIAGYLEISHASSNFKDNYFAGLLDPGTASGTVYAGGAVGYFNSANISGVYWDITLNPGFNDFGRTTGAPVDDPNIFAETTANMTAPTGQIYIDEAWDFTETWRLDNLTENGGYPIPLQLEPEY